MLYYAGAFLMIAIMAGVLGFGGLAAGAGAAAKVLCAVFLLGAVITFVLGRRSPS